VFFMADVAAAIQGQIRKFVFKCSVKETNSYRESHGVVARKGVVKLSLSFYLSALETRFIPKKSELFSLGVG